MSSSNFPKKWLQSSRGLPGSFMNENHHTMTHIWKGDDNRQKGMTTENQTSASPTYMNHDQQNEHQIQQRNEMDELGLLGQEPQRSILGPHNDEFQSQQANFPEDSDYFSRPKTNQHPPPITAMFPQEHLAGGLYKIDQDPPPHIHKTDAGANKSEEDSREEVPELDYDPDPATRAAFQSATKPMMVAKKDSEPAKPSSVAASFDSNRAIKNQPLVSDPIKNNQDVGDYDDDADYYTTSEVMPATYVENSQPRDNDMKMETPTSATPFSNLGGPDMVPKQTSDRTPANSGNTDDVPTKEAKMAPLQASDMYHQQDQNISPSTADAANDSKTSNMMNTGKGPTDEEAPVGTNNQQQQQQQQQQQEQEQQKESLSSLRGDNTIQNSLGGIGDKYKNQNPTKQPFAQTVSANDQIPSHQSEPALSQTNDDNPSNKFEGHRRSSLTQSIGKLFGRHHKSG